MLDFMIGVMESSVVNEAYYGKNNKLLAIEKQIGVVRKKYKEKGKFKANYKDPDLEKLGKMIQDYFEFDIVDINIKSDKQANATTHIVDRGIISGVKGMFMTYTETKEGLKARSKFKNHAIVIRLTSGLIMYDDITDAEIMALILHEIGHNFQGARNNILKMHSAIIVVMQWVSLIQVFSKINGYLLRLDDILNKKKDDKYNDYYDYDDYIDDDYFDFEDDIDSIYDTHNDWISSLKIKIANDSDASNNGMEYTTFLGLMYGIYELQEFLTTMKSILPILQDSRVKSIISKIIKKTPLLFIRNITINIEEFFKSVFYAIRSLLIILSPLESIDFYKGIYKTAKQNKSGVISTIMQLGSSQIRKAEEYLSDDFANMLGYGPELASGILKLENSFKDSNALTKALYSSDLFNSLADCSIMAASILMTPFNQHPITGRRIGQMVVQLEKELNKSDLSPVMKKEIESKIKDLKAISQNMQKFKYNSKQKQIIVQLFSKKSADVLSKKILSYTKEEYELNDCLEILENAYDIDFSKYNFDSNFLDEVYDFEFVEW